MLVTQNISCHNLRYVLAEECVRPTMHKQVRITAKLMNVFGSEELCKVRSSERNALDRLVPMKL